MKLILFIFFIILGLNSNALTQKEALGQVKGMDEREYVERSLKTILYVEYFNQHYAEDNLENVPEFLPIEIWGLNQRGINQMPDKLTVIAKMKLIKESIFTEDFYSKYSEYYRKAVRNEETDGCEGLSLPNCLEDPITPLDKNISIIKLENDFAILERKILISKYKYIEKGIYFLKKQNGIWKLDGVDCYFITEKHTNRCSINFNYQSSDL